MKKSAKLESYEIKEVLQKKVVLLVKYSYIPVGGKEPIVNAMEIRFTLWEKNGIRRIYIDGYYKLGYWDLDRDMWIINDNRQEYMREVINELIKVVKEELKKEEERLQKVK